MEISKVKQAIKQIPGAVPAYTWLRRWGVCASRAIGYVPRKDALVSRAYWERRAVEMWDVDCASATEDEVYRRALEEIVHELQQIPWHRLLEVGCGFGRVLSALREAFPDRDLVGGDFSVNQLDHAKTYLAGKWVGLALVQAVQLPFASQEFDVVLTANTLIYVHPKELGETLRELKRVSRRYLVLAECGCDYLDTPRRRRLMRDAPFYGHQYTAALRQLGLPVVKGRLMEAWAGQPDRLPQSLIVGMRRG